MQRTPRLAAIDLGSNSFHLILAQATPQQGYQVLTRQRQKVRLADGLRADGTLDDAAIQRGIACLASFTELLRDIPQQAVQCVATATLRKATNRADVLRQFEEALGHPIEIISGEREAELIYKGATQNRGQPNEKRLVLDIGGASTEIIVGTGTQPHRLKSLDMGCVVWQNRFFQDGVITAQALDAAKAAAAHELAPEREAFLQYSWQQVCGASGTFRALHDILHHQQHAFMNADWLQQIRRQCIEQGHCRRLGKIGVRRDRQAVFMGGFSILLAIAEGLHLEHIELAQGALREGLMTHLLTRL
ncbi:MAG TPA: Ppx/GppA family phosphatase [Pseudidiomarina sp.]|nr:Ppx/GppA family phosphatase [Pseudidiomarina sp.]